MKCLHISSRSQTIPLRYAVRLSHERRLHRAARRSASTRIASRRWLVALEISFSRIKVLLSARIAAAESLISCSSPRSDRRRSSPDRRSPTIGYDLTDGGIARVVSLFGESGLRITRGAPPVGPSSGVFD